MVNGGPPTPDVVEVLRHLERGLVTTIFFYRKKPERRSLRVKLETRQLLWIKAQGARPEGSGSGDIVVIMNNIQIIDREADVIFVFALCVGLFL